MKLVPEIIAVSTAVHPLASVIEIVYVPEDRFVAVEVVCPSDHK